MSYEKVTEVGRHSCESRNPVDTGEVGRHSCESRNPVNVEPTPHELRDSLETKLQLINLLERGGYIRDRDVRTLQNDINCAIRDLDEIIKIYG